MVASEESLSNPAIMKVALITRSTLRAVPGGDTVQVMETARQLALLGVQADVLLSPVKSDIRDYDLLHFFNITRPADIIRLIDYTNKPFVLSPIWIDYSRFDAYHRNGISGNAFRFLPGKTIEYAKTIARWIRGNDRRPSLRYFINGHHRSIHYIFEKAAGLLTNSNDEYEEIRKYYPTLPESTEVTVGINDELFSCADQVERQSRLVICVGRIEGIKNQLNLVKALNNTEFQLVLIGNAAPNQQDYYKRCRKIAASNINFIEHLPQHNLKMYYQQAKVHVLPSWFESCGLASLEAAAMGCNVVVTRNGFASSYLGNEGYYCDPSSPDSILDVTRQAASADVPPYLQKRIISQHTWKKAAAQTLQVYKKVLSSS
jgi:glycosyltransferase involved in cell wall biosynthesis